MSNVVIFTGAGISVQSGLKTFRDSNGLWEGHRIEEVASPEGFAQNPEKVLHFYNLRRNQLAQVKPNKAHLLCAKLEEHFNVQVITQNVDDLHERAGSTKVCHLHGQLRKVKCVQPNCYFGDIEYGNLDLGNCCPNGHQLRPDIVWFGEEVPAMEEALDITIQSKFFVVIGTSLQVYPAASLVQYATQAKKFIIDPNHHSELANHQITVINKDAVSGTEELYQKLLRFVK